MDLQSLYRNPSADVTHGADKKDTYSRNIFNWGIFEYVSHTGDTK